MYICILRESKFRNFDPFQRERLPYVFANQQPGTILFQNNPSVLWGPLLWKLQ